MAPTPGLDGNFHHCRLPSPPALSQIHSTSQAQTGSDDGLGSNCCNHALALRTGSMHYEKAPLLQKVAVVMGAASAALRCAEGFAPLRRRSGSNYCGVRGGKNCRSDIGKSALARMRTVVILYSLRITTKLTRPTNSGFDSILQRIGVYRS